MVAKNWKERNGMLRKVLNGLKFLSWIIFEAVMGWIEKFKLLFKKRDVLCGNWYTDNEAGFMLCMGSTMTIKKNGTGSYNSWSSGEEEAGGYSDSGTFLWKRIGKNRIWIKDDERKIGTELEYSIEKYEGGYNVIYDKLVSKKKKIGKVEITGFWIFGQEMFREKKNIIKT